MNDIGNLLKSTRETKGLSLEMVARETNISRSYLEALEEERFDVFPGEPYLIGFLRTYSDFLGLSAESVVDRYRKDRIQEQPAPVEALIIKKSPWPSRMVLLSAGGAALVLVLIFALPPLWGALSSIKWDFSGAGSRTPVQHALTGDEKQFDGRLYLMDSVLVPVDNESFTLTLSALDTGVTLTYPQGEARLRPGEEVFADLNNNGDMDVRIFLDGTTSLSLADGAAITVDRVARTSDRTAGSSTLPLGQEALAPQVAPDSIPVTRTTLGTVILTEDKARPFSLDVVFRGYAFFRFQVDDKLREEDYFQKGDTVRVEALRKAVIWVSNAGSFTGRISGNEVDVGKPGEVAAGVVQWVRDGATGKFQLRLEPLY